MKRHLIPLLAALAASPALADPEPIQAQGYPAMMVPVAPGAFNPYMMMPFGLPMSQVPAMVPYGMPMQTVPYMPYMQYPAYPQAMPVAPAVQAEPAPMPVAEAQPAPAPAAPAPVAAPAPAPVPVAAPAPTPAAAAQAPGANPYLSNVAPSPFMTMLSPANQIARRPYEMRRIIEQPEKTQLMQMALPMMTGMMKMGMPDAMNYFARKYKAKPGLSFDDVRDSLFLRANQLNMKKVGENLMWKDFQVVLGDMSAPRIEVYSFCDIAVGRDLLQISPEFVVFLPCRVAVMEDADKNIWVLMLDWNLEWVAGYEQKLGLTNALMDGAKSINSRMDEMMRAAANGDL